MSFVPRVYVIYSAAGRGKTTLALSGTKKKQYFEFDPGSFARAESSLTKELRELITLYRHHPPFDESVFEEMGVLDTSMVGKSGQGPIKVVHKLEGWQEEFTQFRRNFLTAIKTEEDTEDVIIDTSAELWTMEVNAFRQRVNEETNVDRGRLNRLEYEECNAHMVQYIMGAKSKGKNLVFICHEGEVWRGGEPTGQMKPDGWNKVQDYADAVLQMRIRDKKPYAVIVKCGGADLGLVDMEINDPTLDKVNLVIESATILRSEKVDLPDDTDEIIEYAKGFM